MPVNAWRGAGLDRVQLGPIENAGSFLALIAVGLLLVVFALWIPIRVPRRLALRLAVCGCLGHLASRNLFLRDTPWPRKAHLEFVGFPNRVNGGSGKMPPLRR